jgi:short-subunit dehydrogenase
MQSSVCITGAAGGLGKAFTVECASRGWDLFLTDLTEHTLSDLASGISSTYGVRVEYHPCDLTDEASRTELFETAAARGLRFWSLINVAGIDFEGRFADLTREQIRTMLRLNIEAALEMTHSVLALRDDHKRFRLINVSSLASFYPMPVKAAYAASKRFLLDFSLALREELRSIGGTVTALCPAGLPTKPQVIRSIEAQGFLGRITTMNVGYVAARTLDLALRGRPIYIPGAINRILRFLGGMVPAQLTAHLICGRWDAAHRKSHAPLEAVR